MDRTAMHKITYGLYMVASRKEESINGQTANTVMQISADPVTIAIGINKQNLTHEYISSGGYFSVSVLEREAPLSLIGKFGFKSGREEDKFSEVSYELTPQHKIPYLTEHTLAYLEAKVLREMDGGTHTVFLAEVLDARVLKGGEPITYAYYHQVKRGSTPPTAPTYIPKEKERRRVGMDKYVCTVCGYVYDPEEGDPENDIAPGTSFADLPDDWVCPVCAAGKDEFEKED